MLLACALIFRGASGRLIETLVLMLASAVLTPSSSPARTRSAERGRGVGEGGKGREEGASGRSPLIHLDSGCLQRGDKSLLLPFLRGTQRD